MSEEQVANMPRRSVRIADRRERAIRVSCQEFPISDTNITEQQPEDQVVVTARLMPLAMSDLNASSALSAQPETSESEDECRLHQQPPPCEIRYFRPYRDPLTPRQVNEEVRNLLVDHKKYTPARVGYIYCFKHPDDHDIDDGVGPDVLSVIHPIKIGRARNVYRRMKSWSGQCKYQPGLLFKYKMPHHERIEAIVHAQLYNERRKEYLGCSTCGTRHDEWFDVDRDYAEYLVKSWEQFTRHPIAPYDASGYLVPRWHERLQYADMNDENCWTWFTHGNPADTPLSSHAGGTQGPQSSRAAAEQ